ncbi:MAG TPA: amidohydrolase family protein [Chloroflexota bacterium]|nr:amidohydrolase family protein [Chloroflexota bacterium]
MFQDVKVLDVHSHIHDAPMADRTQPPRLTYQFWHDLWFIQGLGAAKPLPNPIAPGKHSDRPGNRDEDFQAVAETLAKYLQVRKVDAQIISPHPLQFHGWMEDDIQFRSWITYQNDLAFKIVQARPDVFLGSCQLPQRADAKDTEHCLEELERCVTELGFVAAYVSPDSNGKGNTPPMNTAYWHPLYQKCQDLGVPIIVHGTDVLNPNFHAMDMNRYFEFNFMVPQSIAMATLRQHPEVFERFPSLKIIICHCGGFLDRLGPDHPFRANEHRQRVSGGLFYDTAAYDLDFLSLAIKQRGVSQFTFGTEAPGSGTELRPGTNHTADDLIPMFEEHPTLSFLTDAEKKDILHNTPAKLAPALADTTAQNAKAKVKAY